MRNRKRWEDHILYFNIIHAKKKKGSIFLIRIGQKTILSIFQGNLVLIKDSFIEKLLAECFDASKFKVMESVYLVSDNKHIYK